MYCLVTGADFIDSNLIDRLLQEGHAVVAYDNFVTGQAEFLSLAQRSPRFRLVPGDTLELSALTRAMEGCECVFHLTANADVRSGTQHPRKDLEQNTLGRSMS